MSAQKMLAELIGPKFEMWFKDAIFTPEEVSLASQYQAEWVEANYARELIEVFGSVPKLTVQKKKQERHTAQVIQLPLWPEPTRGAPNSFLRSALFAAIQGKTRRYMKGEFLAAQKGVSVSFTGMQLDQSDLDVWQQAADIAKAHPLGNVCHFRANAFLKSIGRSNGKSNYKWLHEAINRLIACAVEIRCGSKVFSGSLIHECLRDEETGIYKLTLSPSLIKLFGASDWTALERQQREALKGKPLALWLHGFYASHAAPFPLKVETLQELSGSAT